MQPKDPQHARVKALERKKRKVLRRLQKALERADLNEDDKRELSDWEDEFLRTVQERLDDFDRAFHDPDKGRLDEALSYLQSVKLKEIEDKLKGKVRKGFGAPKGFKAKKPMKRVSAKKDKASGWKSVRLDRDFDGSAENPETNPAEPEPPVETPPPKPAGGKNARRPFLRVIKGGK